jgi:hypothetical protein
VDSWKNNRIKARSAVIVRRSEESTQIFGIVSISARTDVDKETRLVSFEDVTIREASFPSATSMQAMLARGVRKSIPSWLRPVSLDRLLTDISITEAAAKTESVPLKDELPKHHLQQSARVADPDRWRARVRCHRGDMRVYEHSSRRTPGHARSHSMLRFPFQSSLSQRLTPGH